MHFLAKPLIGYKNLIIFTAYYFSTPLLIATFAEPWKRYSWKKSKRGFHPGELVSVGISNLISRVIGIILRSVAILLGLCGIGGMVLVGLPLSLFISVIDPGSHIFHLGDLLSSRPLAADWHFGFTPTLDRYSEDLYDHTLKFPLVDRKNEMATILRALSQDTKGHIMLVGEPGAGRHSLLVSLAKQMVTSRFMLFDYVAFLKDKKNDDAREGALQDLLAEAAQAGNIVLIVDNAEHLVAYAHIIEDYLAAPSFHVIAITSPASYHQDILPNKLLMKYFETITLSQLSKEFVKKAVDMRVDFHNLPLSEKTRSLLVDASYQLTSLESKHQPEAAISLLDEFVSYSRKNRTDDPDTQVTQFLEGRLKIPFGAIGEREKTKLNNLDYLLGQRVIGQKEALTGLAKAIKRRRLSISGENKPIGSFLFLGPTGVGKTETAKALAAIFFEDEKKMIRLDMARYQYKAQTAELLQELSKAIREQPYGVVLLDEIEKANHDVLMLFLTIFDEGYFHDPDHNQVLCNNHIFIATSNAGSDFIRENITSLSQPALIDHIIKKRIFSPEFINRFDAVVAFMPLSPETIRSVIRQKLEALNRRLAKIDAKPVAITDDLIQHISGEGVQKEFGAREIDRTIKRLVEDKVAEDLLK